MQGNVSGMIAGAIRVAELSMTPLFRRDFDSLDARFDIDRFTHDALGVLKGEGGRQ